MWDSVSFDTSSFSTTSWDFGVVEDVSQNPGGLGGDDTIVVRKPQAAIFKPTGLTLTKPVKNKDVARRIAETAEIHAEVASVEQTVTQPLPTLDAKLAEQSGAALLTYEMSQMEMIAEIKTLLENAARSDEEEALLLIFMEAI